MSTDDAWWKVAKARSLERRAARDALTKLTANRGDSFLIVTEGTVTEPRYFKELTRILRLGAVSVRVIPGKASDPRHVIETAAQEAKAQARKARAGTLSIHEPARFDHVWAVIDTDVATRSKFWADVKQLSKARKVKLAHSTPCFEYWLILHFQFTTRTDLTNGDKAKEAFKALCGEYCTNELVAEKVFKKHICKWEEAVKNAVKVRKHHETACNTIPYNPSTDIDLLVAALAESAVPRAG